MPLRLLPRLKHRMLRERARESNRRSSVSWREGKWSTNLKLKKPGTNYLSSNLRLRVSRTQERLMLRQRL